MYVPVIFTLVLLSSQPSKWARRTSKRRQQTQDLLSSIHTEEIHGRQHEISILQAPEVDWVHHPTLDPQQGGKLKVNSLRALRKRRAIEAFLHVCRKLDLKEGSSIVDAGSGAGNLAIPLAGLLPQLKVLAIDVNTVALERLRLRSPSVQTLAMDLAQDIDLASHNASMVVSLHACGAATDMAIRLATQNSLPFCVSPCCTAKAITPRGLYGPAASAQRSGAPVDITYPRSQWLNTELLQRGNVQTSYETLAKVADVGLGPQTPPEQVEHQARAKHIVEWDRLLGVLDRHDYEVGMYFIRDHEGYGKREILVGTPKDQWIALK